MTGDLKTLLYSVFGETTPQDIADFFDDKYTFNSRSIHNSLLGRREAKRQANMARMDEHRSLSRTLADLHRRRDELAGLLAGSTLHRLPAEVGGWMIEQAGVERVLLDTQARIDELAEPDPASRALDLLVAIADELVKLRPPGDDPIEVPESVVPYLPERLQRRVDVTVWERNRAAAEAGRAEREKAEAAKIEAEQAAAAELAGRIEQVQAMSLDDIAGQLFSDPYQREAVRSVFKTAMLPNQYSGRLLIENSYNQLCQIRRMEPVRFAMIERLRDAASLGLKTDIPEPDGTIRLTPGMMVMS